MLVGLNSACQPLPQCDENNWQAVPLPTLTLGSGEEEERQHCDWKAAFTVGPNLAFPHMGTQGF